jgi:hypothetical protein
MPEEEEVNRELRRLVYATVTGNVFELWLLFALQTSSLACKLEERERHREYLR